jgi:uncharacterized protein (TIGR02145 family)
MKLKFLKLFIMLVLATGLNVLYAQSLKDIEGNVYKTVTIGTQVWMAENLKTTKFNDGTPIPLVKGDTAWGELTKPAYCWYKNNASNKYLYGALYNWNVVKTNKLCPKDWHVPSDAEWTALTTALGGIAVAGGKLMEKGTVHWAGPNTGATNERGFNALPAGYRNLSGTFVSMGINAAWWTSKSGESYKAWYRIIASNYLNVYRSQDYTPTGFSVRCIYNFPK